VPEKRWNSEKICNSCHCDVGKTKQKHTASRHKKFTIGGCITVDESDTGCGHGCDHRQAKDQCKVNCQKTLALEDNIDSNLPPCVDNGVTSASTK
jgi:hypothetical protein